MKRSAHEGLSRTEKRWRAPSKLAMVASMFVLTCLVMEDVAGVYIPSETTGQGGNLCGLVVLVVALMFVAWYDRLVPIHRSALAVGAVALCVATVSAVVEFIYFEWILGGFDERMAVFTRSTLAARGAEAAHIEDFTRTIKRSWASSNVALNTFLMLTVWGSLVGLMNMCLVRVVTRLFRGATSAANQQVR